MSPARAEPEWIDADDLADACARHALTIAPRDIVLLA